MSKKVMIGNVNGTPAYLAHDENGHIHVVAVGGGKIQQFVPEDQDLDDVPTGLEPLWYVELGSDLEPEPEPEPAPEPTEEGGE